MSAKKYKILLTTDKDLVKTLHDKIFPLDDWYESNRSIMWILWHGKDPVGFCMMSETNDDYVFHSRAGITSGHRGNNLQVRMLRVRERYARSRGFKKAITYTKIDNIVSNHNLQKAGYWLYLPQYRYADKDCLYWIKNL
jgi:hypothetical protein